MLLLTQTRRFRSSLLRLNDPIFFQRLAPISNVPRWKNSIHPEYLALIKNTPSFQPQKSFKLLERNTVKELEEKLSMIETSLSLSSEERDRLLFVYPRLMIQEKKELEERIRHFREDWNCSDDQIKIIFTKTKKFQFLSLENLKQMHSIYSNKWKIEKERLPTALFNSTYWQKYHRQFITQKDGEMRKLIKDIKSFYKDEFGKTSSLGGDVLPTIIASKIFEKNSQEEIKEKLSYLSSHLLLSQEEASRVMSFVPIILNESFEELKKKVEFFKVKLGCSEKEWKSFYLSRKVILTCPLWQLELIYQLLSEEYDLQSPEIIRILLHPSFTSSRLSEMIENIEERKFLLNIIYNKKSNQKRYALVGMPETLWLKPEVIKRKINLFVEGFGCDTSKVLSSSVITHNHAILYPERFILNICKQFLSLLMADLPTPKMKKPIDLSKGALIDPNAWPKKYDDVMKRLSSDENKVMSLEKEIQSFQIEARGKDEEVHKAFVVDKSETWLMMGKDKQRVSQQASELACALALAKSCDEVSNPYHRFLRETVEEGSKLDVLRELGGYEEALKKMGKALRKGMVRESSVIDDNDVKEEEGVGWLALKMFGAKEVEKLALSHEDALKICLSGNLNCFTAKFSKLMIMSSRFLLRGEDLLHDGFVSPILFLHHDANFSKAMILARAAERFIKDGGVEGGNTAIEAWKNGIGEKMRLEEGREYYRNHPVMKLVTEVILKTSMSFCRHSALHIERVISTWEKTDVKKRKWDQLCQDLNHSKRLKDKGREGAEEPRPVRNLNQHSLKDSL